MSAHQATPTAVLLLSCRDRRGLVAAVSDFIFRHRGNIVHADQHADPEEDLFIQRVEWQLDGFDLDRQEIAGAFNVVARRLGIAWSLHFSDELPRVALMASKLPHCLYDLLVRWRLGELRAEISLVVSNHREVEPIAREFDVPFHHLPVSRETKDECEERLIELLDETDIDLVVLARYMQILTDRVIDRYAHRILNIHHSFLPAFAGGRPYHQAHHRGVKLIGATAHYATAELDEGPIIDQDVARVSHRDSVGDLVRKGRELEKVVLARAVRLHLEQRVVVYGNKTIVFD